MPVKLYEWDKNETGWIWIEVTPNKVINLILRSLNNLIHVNDNNEVYVDLQLEDWLESSDSLPIWVNVGRVLAADGRPVTGTLISWQTTSWDWVKVLYGDDWKLYVDNGTGEWNILQYELNAWLWIEIWDYYTNQWPAPVGFHIPTREELQALCDAMTALGLTSWGDDFKLYLKMPYAWICHNGVIGNKGTDWYYSSCNNRGDATDWRLSIYNNSVNISRWPKIEGRSIRCFKNSSIAPDLSWTILYDGSSVEQWAWIFHNTTDGLISISSDWSNWITIQDKNLWATIVYNDGDTLAQNNCWYFYQRWNNYGFAYDGVITTSSVKVDASWYWPKNYYSSNIFIDAGDSWDWSSVPNNNLRWWITWVIENAINNTWVLSVNGETWHVITKQPWVVEIEISEDGNWDARWNITWWTLIDGSVVLVSIDNLLTITDITSFYLSTDEVELVPWLASIANGDVFTWMYKEQNGTKGIFVWQKRTPTP